MNYAQTLEYLYSQLPLFSRIGAAAYKKDLTNTITLCNSLHNPQDHFKSIHIAGTNGKGSTSHMLAAVLQQSGYKTALYTSPHLKDFRERIKINGKMISKDFIVDFVERTKELWKEISPSFFEVTVAMAFEYFKEKEVEVAVIETGLGGRLDSTNIIIPVVSVITNIGYDHMNILGDTLEKIASEKAGIIKANTPVIIGRALSETRPIFENTANEKKAPIIFAEELFSEVNAEHSITHLEAVVKMVNGPEETYTLDLNGHYQVENLITVLTVIDTLNSHSFKISKHNAHVALSKVKEINGLHGRWDVIHKKPLIVLDVAHNKDGIEQLVKQISFTEHEKLHIVLGIVNDKDTNGTLGQLPVDAVYYFTRAQIPRALDENELKLKANAFGLRGESYPEVNTALESAKDSASQKDLIVVCGSVFLVGEVAPIFNNA